MTIIAAPNARLIFMAGARHEIDIADAVDALRRAGYAVDLAAVYAPTGDPRADVEALLDSDLVVQAGPVDDAIVSLTAYGMRIPVISRTA
jgi:hypothetical protein